MADDGRLNCKAPRHASTLRALKLALNRSSGDVPTPPRVQAHADRLGVRICNGRIGHADRPMRPTRYLLDVEDRAPGRTAIWCARCRIATEYAPVPDAAKVPVPA